MPYGLNIRGSAALDFVSLGALVYRLDPGIVPFRKATQCAIHVSGGEFNVAANLANCFGLKTGIATAMVDYPIGDLIAERVRAMGVQPFYKRFQHDGVTGPNMATARTRPAHVSGRATSTGTRSSLAACVGFTAAGYSRRSHQPPENSSLKECALPRPLAPSFPST